MSDLNEGEGELPPELRDFYDAHRSTGEPTGAQLGKALLRLHTGTRPAAPMRLSGRRWLPPEVMAVAALLIISIAGAGLGWSVKTRTTSAANTEAMTEARRAWTGGNLDSTLAALERCTSDDCVRLAAAVKRVGIQMTGQDPLHPVPEPGSLLALDRELAEGRRSPITEQLSREPSEGDDGFAKEQAEALMRQGFPPDVATRAVTLFVAGLEAMSSSPELATRNFREVISLVPGTLLARRAEKRTQLLVSPAPPEPVVEAPSPAPIAEPAPPPNPELVEQLSALLDQGKQAKKEQRFAVAIDALQRCLALSPNDADCTVTLGATYAQRGTNENNNADNEKAVLLYRKFLRIASPDDPRVRRVREILGEPEGARAEAVEVKDLYLRAYQLREAAPEEARRLFEEVVRKAPDSLDAQKAQRRLAELGAASPMGRLKVASNPTRARIFIDGVDTGRETPVLPSAPLLVPPGRHTIYGDVGGRRSATTQLNVVEGDNPVVKLTIE